jgi:hypothetical protein
MTTEFGGWGEEFIVKNALRKKKKRKKLNHRMESIH